MFAVDLPRGLGKTTALVSYMLAPGNEDVVLYAPTLAQAENARRIAEKIAGTIQPNLRFRKIPDDLNDLKRDGRFVVDEADGVFRGIEALAFSK